MVHINNKLRFMDREEFNKCLLSRRIGNNVLASSIRIRQSKILSIYIFPIELCAINLIINYVIPLDICWNSSRYLLTNLFVYELSTKSYHCETDNIIMFCLLLCWWNCRVNQKERYIRATKLNLSTQLNKVCILYTINLLSHLFIIFLQNMLFWNYALKQFIKKVVIFKMKLKKPLFNLHTLV